MLFSGYDRLARVSRALALYLADPRSFALRDNLALRGKSLALEGVTRVSYCMRLAPTLWLLPATET
jgi:hypothetical protein